MSINTSAERWIDCLRRGLIARNLVRIRHQLELLVINHVPNYNDCRPNRVTHAKERRPENDTGDRPLPASHAIGTNRCDGHLEQLEVEHR
ncbi:MAG TPA: hypothetical protein ENI86_06865, partial [Acidimicrobiales bacterium]|nr:hypothetical protein [Acidimicrobiales bacterium]